MIAEPLPAQFPNSVVRYFAATRPAFLSVTLAGCLIGLATAHGSGVPIDAAKAVLTVVFALVAHAGVNVVNDYYDALSGADAANDGRLFPFTGGSRFIQNGVIGPRETGLFGYALLLSVIPPGLWLAWHSAPGLLLIGLAGLGVGWAYSAPPLKLMCRGVGEFAIIAAWLLVAIGADFVQRGAFAWTPVLAGLPFALLVANILYINQFPDRVADAHAGKRTAVVRLGARRARWGYLAIVLIAYAWLAAVVFSGALPAWTATGLATLPISLGAARGLLANAERPGLLGAAIRQTILAANLHGLIMAAALVAS
ncbi:MAG: prenyltransferase [Betaproteobacteria bacterium]|nr:prenyltransferase [Betaproteobacteria bacterium]